MACSNPLPLFKNKRFSLYPDLPYRYYVGIPCNRCLNCRIDKINQYTDRCEYELIKRGCGAFVTFTYDNLHIDHLYRRDSNGKLVATLSKDDSRRFLYRLNKNVKNELKKLGYDTLPIMQKDYKYILSGEYGDHGKIFDRPHFHCLFFGLDYAFCKKLFARSWRGQGQIKVLPITNGAPQYLLDYITTMEYGEMRKIKYDNNNIERPFQVHSIGLGNGLYYSQLDYIKKHKNCYHWHGKDRPIPSYYRDKFLLPKTNIYERFQNINTKAYLDGALPKSSNLYDLHNYIINNAKLRERNLQKRIKRPFIRQDMLDKELFKYKRNTNIFYRQCHPMPHDVGFSQKVEMELFSNYSNFDIAQLVNAANLSQIPF